MLEMKNNFYSKCDFNLYLKHIICVSNRITEDEFISNYENTIMPCVNLKENLDNNNICYKEFYITKKNIYIHTVEIKNEKDFYHQPITKTYHNYYKCETQTFINIKEFNK